MINAIMTWETVHLHGDLWWQHHKLRKELFVDKFGWDVPHNREAEWDQYDTGNTVYVITHNKGYVLAASRLNPCSFESAGWSYMIKDAHRGKLSGIPQDILSEVTFDSTTWEATRFTVDPKLPEELKDAALESNAKALADAAKQLGISKLIALMPPGYIRWLSNRGLKTMRAGPTKRDSENDRMCVMEMSL